MSTTFPTTLQDLDATRGTSGQPLSSPNHITHHTKEDDTIEALQAKVGVDNSAVTTSLDYITKHLPMANLGATGTPSSSTFLRGDGTWSQVVLDTYSNYHINGTLGTMRTYTSDVLGAYAQMNSDTVVRFQGVGLPIQTRTITSDWAAADLATSAVLLGSYLYVNLKEDGTTSFRVYRYDKTNLAAGGTLMTVSGTAFGTNATGYTNLMVSDDVSNLYFTYQAGNSASAHIISKYSISGTVLTFVSNTTCGSDTANFERILKVDSSGNIYGFDPSTSSTIKKYNSSGTLQTTYIITTGDVSASLAGNVYLRHTGASNDAGNVYNRINL